MKGPLSTGDEKKVPWRFVEALRLLADFDKGGSSTKLFPKTCRVCARNFHGFSEYLCATTPKGHVFEDCREVMKKPFTMVYRHCPCGNTLVLTLTEKNFPALDLFWSLLHEEARHSDQLLSSVVAEFSTECDRYLLLLHNPCLGNEQRLDAAFHADLDGDE